jgi:hypothetical protein
VRTENVLVSTNSYSAYSQRENREVILNKVDRILNNILMCSSLVMSDCGLLLELGSFHLQGQCELLIISSSGQACLQFSIRTPFLLDSSSPDSTGVLHR